MMVQTKSRLNVTLQVELTAMLVFSQLAQTFSKVEETYKDNIYYNPQGPGIAGLGVNIDRQSYKYTSKTTDEEKTSTKKALLNKDFRQALNFAFDRTAYSAQLNGEKGAPLAVRSLFVKTRVCVC